MALTGTKFSYARVAGNLADTAVTGAASATRGGLLLNRIVLLQGTGQVDTSVSFGTGFDSTVHALAAQTTGGTGYYVVGGAFTSYQGVSGPGYDYLVRLSTGAALDKTFDTVAGADASVLSISLGAGNQLVVGGTFTNLAGAARSQVGRFNADGTLDTGFVPPALAFSGGAVAVNSVAVDANTNQFLTANIGKVVIGGQFTSVGGTARGRVARLNTDGALDTSFMAGLAGADNTVNAVAVLGSGKVLIGGQFTTVNGTSRGGIALLNTDGTLDATFLLSKIDIPVSFRDLPGHQGFWGTYSNGHYNNLQPTAYIDPNVGPVVAFGQDTGSWAVFYAADQALYVDPSNPKRSWGLFTNIGLADNGPSPVRWSANVGLGGSSPFVSRPLDTFGIGYSYIGYSSPVKDLAPVLLPVRDDQAVELYYNYAVTPWFRLTPDLQVLIPARERTLPPGAQAIDTALAIGLRAKIDF